MKPTFALLASVGSLLVVLLTSFIVSARAPEPDAHVLVYDRDMTFAKSSCVMAAYEVSGPASDADPGDILTNANGDLFIGADLQEEACSESLRQAGYPWEGYALMVLVGVLLGGAIAGKLIELTFPRLSKWEPVLGALIGAIATGPFVSGFPELSTGGFVFGAIGGVSASWLGPSIRSGIKALASGIGNFFARKTGGTN